MISEFVGRPNFHTAEQGRVVMGCRCGRIRLGGRGTRRHRQGQRWQGDRYGRVAAFEEPVDDGARGELHAGAIVASVSGARRLLTVKEIDS